MIIPVLKRQVQSVLSEYSGGRRKISVPRVRKIHRDIHRSTDDGIFPQNGIITVEAEAADDTAMGTQLGPLLKDATPDDSNHESGPALSCARRCELSNISSKKAILPFSKHESGPAPSCARRCKLNKVSSKKSILLISNHEKGQASSDAPRCDLMESPS